jgi:DNA polymerase-3 subunit beta
MKLLISRADLARVLTNVGRVVEARNTIPILSNVLLSASDGKLQVTGTDLDIVATDSAPADVTTPGALCVDAKLLSDIAKKAGGDVTLSEDKGQLIVTSGRSRFALGTLPAGDFPTLDGGKFTATFDIDLGALFAPVAFSISTEETRYYLNGIFLHVVDGKIVAVATDGHRLSRHIGPSTEDKFVGIIVPRKTVGLIPKGTVSLSVSESKIRVEAGEFSLTSKLIDGTFPDYPRVIPQNNDKLVTVDRDAFMKAADRVATVSSEKGKAVRLSVAPGSVAFHVSNPDSGSASDEVEAEYSGEPIEIGFNSQYILEIFGVLPSGPVVLALSEPGSPGLLTSVGFEGLTLVLMPMRI